MGKSDVERERKRGLEEIAAACVLRLMQRVALAGRCPLAGSPEPRAQSLPEVSALGQASVSPSKSAGTENAPFLGARGNAQ